MKSLFSFVLITRSGKTDNTIERRADLRGSCSLRELIWYCSSFSAPQFSRDERFLHSLAFGDIDSDTEIAGDVAAYIPDGELPPAKRSYGSRLCGCKSIPAPSLPFPVCRRTPHAPDYFPAFGREPDLYPAPLMRIKIISNRYLPVIFQQQHTSSILPRHG